VRPKRRELAPLKPGTADTTWYITHIEPQRSLSRFVNSATSSNLKRSLTAISSVLGQFRSASDKL
jgi:hypothetical protein